MNKQEAEIIVKSLQKLNELELGVEEHGKRMYAVGLLEGLLVEFEKKD